jgi:hypothetical protein
MQAVPDLPGTEVHSRIGYGPEFRDTYARVRRSERALVELRTFRLAATPAVADLRAY